MLHNKTWMWWQQPPAGQALLQCTQVRVQVYIRHGHTLFAPVVRTGRAEREVANKINRLIVKLPWKAPQTMLRPCTRAKLRKSCRQWGFPHCKRKLWPCLHNSWIQRTARRFTSHNLFRSGPLTSADPRQRRHNSRRIFSRFSRISSATVLTTLETQLFVLPGLNYACTVRRSVYYVCRLTSLFRTWTLIFWASSPCGERCSLKQQASELSTFSSRIKLTGAYTTAMPRLNWSWFSLDSVFLSLNFY